jgi:hypothetical protein
MKLQNAIDVGFASPVAPPTWLKKEKRIQPGGEMPLRGLPLKINWN